MNFMVTISAGHVPTSFLSKNTSLSVSHVCSVLSEECYSMLGWGGRERDQARTGKNNAIKKCMRIEVKGNNNQSRDYDNNKSLALRK